MMTLVKHSTMQDNYLVLYIPGMCGTWLNWLVNQHDNFPQYNVSLKLYKNDLEERIPLDVGCLGADWYIYKHMKPDFRSWGDYIRDIKHCGLSIHHSVRTTDLQGGEGDITPEIFLNSTFEENRHIRRLGEVNNESFIKDSVKVLCNHGCFNETSHTDKLYTVDKELLIKIKDDMKPKKIIVPIFNTADDSILKRWIMFSAYHTRVRASTFNSELINCKTIWQNTFDLIMQENSYGTDVHYVDMKKLISGDNDEYLKLCEALDEQPIPNIQEEITSYRDILSNVASHFDRISQKNC